MLPGTPGQRTTAERREQGQMEHTKMLGWHRAVHSEHPCVKVARARSDSSRRSRGPAGEEMRRTDPPEDAEQQAGDEEGSEGARHDHGRLQGGQVSEQAGDAGHQSVAAAIGATAARHRRLPRPGPGGIHRPGARRRVLWLRRRRGLDTAGAGGGHGQEHEQQQQKRWQQPQQRRRAHRAGGWREARRGARLSPGPAPAQRPVPGAPAAEAAARRLAGNCSARKSPRRSHTHVAPSHSTDRGPRGRGRPPGRVAGCAPLTRRPNHPKDLGPL